MTPDLFIAARLHSVLACLGLTSPGFILSYPPIPPVSTSHNLDASVSLACIILPVRAARISPTVRRFRG